MTFVRKTHSNYVDEIDTWRQSYETTLVFKKSKLVLNSLAVHYLNLDQNNTESII